MNKLLDLKEENKVLSEMNKNLSYRMARSSLLVLILLGSARLSQAQFGLALSSGQGILDIVPYRFAVSWDFGSVWQQESLWGLNVLWESSAAVWNSPSRTDLSPERATDLNAYTTGPMLRWQRQNPLAGTGIRATPYAELGVGLSWLTQTEIQGRVLSLHFQFEDKIGLGMRFGKKQQYDLALRAYHYSNASIKRPNSGVNLAMMSFGVWL